MIGRLVVVGLGLIGGSFAKGLRESGLCGEVVGVDLDPQSRKLAVELGVVDRCEADLALACQRVENLVVGAPCGVMDQMTSSTGKEGHLLELLCQPATIQGRTRIPAPGAWSIVRRPHAMDCEWRM